VQHAIDDVGRIRVGGRLAGFNTAALVDRDVHHDRAIFHRAQVFAADEARGPRALHQHRADDEVCLGDLLTHSDR
jgi:hypothetical protein